MTTYAYDEVPGRLGEIWDRVATTREPAELARAGHEPMVLLPASELSALLEAAHHLRSSENMRRIFASIERASAGRTKPVTMEELYKLIER